MDSEHFNIKSTKELRSDTKSTEKVVNTKEDVISTVLYGTRIMYWTNKDKKKESQYYQNKSPLVANLQSPKL
jgi:hypothetical protein